MRRASVTVLVVIVLIGVLLAMSVYTIDQRRAAIKFQLGEVVRVETQPGLYFKMPRPFENVVYLDKRTLTLDTPDAEPFAGVMRPGAACADAPNGRQTE